MKLLILVVLILAWLAIPAQADSGRGLAAYSRGDFARALQIWLPLAEQGDVRAQTGLGVLYYNGQGVAPDYEVALRWFSSAATLGDADAQFNLGIMHAYGLGVPRDLNAGRGWAARAAAQGHGGARSWLNGRASDPRYGQEVVPQMARRYEAGLAAFEAGDHVGAVTEWKQVAALGVARGQNSLGVMYDQGLGVAANHGQAVALFRQAAQQGHAGGQANLGLMYLRGRGVAQDEQEALRWLLRAAQQGHVAAQFHVGQLYASGLQVVRDPAQAAAWYRRAGDKGHVRAQYNLAVLYDTGQGVRLDRAMAADWYRRAALSRLAEAQYNLGVLHLNGDGVALDLEQAHAWFDLAASLGGQSLRDRAVRLREQTQEALSTGQMTRARIIAYQWYARQASSPADPVGQTLLLSVQSALAAQGFDPGPIDGRIGPRTRAAIEQYMTRSGGQVAGR